jgi:hypothetical protein
VIVKCRNGHDNRVPDATVTKETYRCGSCRAPIDVVWASTGSATLAMSEPRTERVADSRRSQESVSKIPALVSAGLLILAVASRWPYGFYTMLRLVTCASAVYLAWQAGELNKKSWVWLMGAMALIFNPLIPIRMGRSDWAGVDLLAALLFLFSIPFIAPKKPRARGS